MEGRARALSAYKQVTPTFRKKLGDVLCFPCRRFCAGTPSVKPLNVEELNLDKEKEYFGGKNPERLRFLDKYDLIFEPGADPVLINW